MTRGRNGINTKRLPAIKKTARDVQKFRNVPIPIQRNHLK